MTSNVIGAFCTLCLVLLYHTKNAIAMLLLKIIVVFLHIIDKKLSINVQVVAITTAKDILCGGGLFQMKSFLVCFPDKASSRVWGKRERSATNE